MILRLICWLFDVRPRTERPECAHEWGDWEDSANPYEQQRRCENCNLRQRRDVTLVIEEQWRVNPK